jgi:hypothetical protein
MNKGGNNSMNKGRNNSANKSTNESGNNNANNNVNLLPLPLLHPSTSLHPQPGCTLPLPDHALPPTLINPPIPQYFLFILFL